LLEMVQLLIHELHILTGGRHTLQLLLQQGKGTDRAGRQTRAGCEGRASMPVCLALAYRCSLLRSSVCVPTSRNAMYCARSLTSRSCSVPPAPPPDLRLAAKLIEDEEHGDDTRPVCDQR
jgi:hypothetical protein